MELELRYDVSDSLPSSSNMKGCCGIANCNGIFGIDVLCKDLFEFGNLRTTGQVVGLESLDYGSDILFRDILSAIGYRKFQHVTLLRSLGRHIP